MECKIRLQKILALAGIASRRKAENLIEEGRVTINGTMVTQPGAKANPVKDYIKIVNDVDRLNELNISQQEMYKSELELIKKFSKL